MTRRSFTNQEVQIGKEATHGAGGGASHILGGMATWTLGAKPTTKQFPTAGRHYMSASALLTDESSGKVTGVGDFSTVAYILGSHCFQYPQSGRSGWNNLRACRCPYVG